MKLINLSGAAVAAAMLTILPASARAAHPGGLNGEGCHNNRRTGDYHCHGAGRASQPVRATGGGGAFQNRAAARAAGAAPVRRGDPGYGPHLDRDNDGVGCER